MDDFNDEVFEVISDGDTTSISKKESLSNDLFEEEPQEEVEDKVNNPKHYSWLKELCGIEPIDICRHLSFPRGSAVKYLLRAGYKEEEGYSKIDKCIEDLKKAKYYIDDEIEELEKEKDACKGLSI